MNWTSAILGAFLASAIIFGLTAAALWPLMRRAFLGWMAARMAALTVMILALSGLLDSLVPVGARDMVLVGAIATDLSLACCGPLLADYAESHIHAPRNRRRLRQMLPLVLVPVALLPAVIYAERLDWLHDGLMGVLLAILAVNMVGLMRRGSRAAAFQSAAWTPGILLGFAAVGHELFVGGMLPHYVAAMTVALLTEFIITAAGIVDGFMVIKRERDDAVAGFHAARIATATDPLTNIANRRGLTEHFARKAASPPVGLALIDCDHFKRINDQFGHMVGDKVLVAVAEGLGGDDQFEARLGGEEFVLLLYAADWQSQAETARRRITQMVRERVPDLPYPVTASAGLTGVLPGEELAEAMKRADRALYAAKEAGRNRSLALTEFRPRGDGLIEAA